MDEGGIPMKRKVIILATLLCFMLPLGIPAQVHLGGGNIRFSPKGAKPVIFNHEKHLAVTEHKCSICHSGDFQMEKGSNKMNMSMMTKGHFCGTCHNGKTAFDVEDLAQCKKCHQ
jgi:c(7)-type cytochrome triheme protein